MDPVVWGPPLWALLHSASLSRTKHAAEEIEKVLDAMEHVLPCVYCRESLKILRPVIHKIKFEGTFEKIWALHNAVSAKLQIQKGSGAPITLERARRRWEKTSEPVSELQLLHALIVTAGNYKKCPDKDKIHWYTVMWEGVANLCILVPTLRDLGHQLHGDAQKHRGCALLKSAEIRRRRIMKKRGIDMEKTADGCISTSSAQIIRRARSKKAI